ncbi:CBS domain-containing protein [Candidatus Micrarchaeota archaeon]|nr:CBS domain-containing protein [Candidatus Micrarchaeota archaeon]
MGSELRVGDIMTENVVVVPFGKSVTEVAKIMKQHKIGSLIVVESAQSKQAKGIVTERDLVHKIVALSKDPNVAKVEEVMSGPLRVVHPETTLEDASKAMRENRIKRLPVVNKKNELIGILTEGDIMKIFPAVVDLLEEKSTLG